jgi:plastocyanin
MRRAALLVVVAALVGCGEDDEGGGGGAGEQTIELRADPGGKPAFDKTELKAEAGKLTVVLDNPSDVDHAIEVEGNGEEARGAVVTKGTSTATLEVKEGTYEFYCPVGNHAQAGMKGTLVVGKGDGGGGGGGSVY